MAVISSLGIFRLENHHIPWICCSTQCNIQLPMAKHILLQVNANSWKSLSLGPICSHTTTNPDRKLPEKLRNYCGQNDVKNHLCCSKEYSCNKLIKWLFSPALKLKWNILIIWMEQNSRYQKFCPFLRATTNLGFENPSSNFQYYTSGAIHQCFRWV